VNGLGALRFRYARSADDVSLAYTRLGSGPPLLVVPPVPFSNVSGEWSVPLIRDVHSRLAADLEVILYDGRGTGASQRSVVDLSLEALTSDIPAVMDAAGIARASLLAIYLAAVPALHFAARQPDRVDRLVLFGAAPDLGATLHRGDIALYRLMEDDWPLFTQTAALDWMGWGVGEAGRLVADSLRAATTPETARALLHSIASVDLATVLGDVRAETLVLHRRGSTHVPLEVSSALAAALPNARLHVLEGASATLYFDDPSGTADLITSFIRPDRPVRPGVGPDGPPLSDREEQVLGLIASGDSNVEIAHQLGLSIHTVERHAANIYRKIGARGRADATAWAMRRRLG
jgi:DNA-binding CsgD family transcriptional regulator/pimeloyl-ACP methyl ester carboxylesterase